METNLPIVFDPGSNKGILAARDLGEVGTFCELIRRAGMVPRGMEKQETMQIAVIAGIERGLTPMQALNGVCVINNRPTLFGDTMLALCQRTGEMEDFSETFEGTGDDLRAVCVVKRRGRASAYTASWSIRMAKAAGLLGKSGPWQQYPSRMLAARARSQALRAVFADVLCGMYAREDFEGDADPVSTAPIQIDAEVIPEVVEAYTLPDMDWSGLDANLVAALKASATAERWTAQQIQAAIDARKSTPPPRRRREPAPAPVQEPIPEPETVPVEVVTEPASSAVDELL